MAVKDYREMYIATIMALGKEKGIVDVEISRSYLAQLSFDELKKLAQKLQD